MRFAGFSGPAEHSSFLSLPHGMMLIPRHAATRAAACSANCHPRSCNCFLSVWDSLSENLKLSRILLAATGSNGASSSFPAATNPPDARSISSKPSSTATKRTPPTSWRCFVRLRKSPRRKTTSQPSRPKGRSKSRSQPSPTSGCSTTGRYLKAHHSSGNGLARNVGRATALQSVRRLNL